MSIKQKLNEVLTEAENDTSNTIANLIGYRAIEAIVEGVGSQAWEDYMRIFASTEEELKRLTFEDPMSQDPDIKENIVYLVSYATCTAATLTKMRDKVQPVIDSGL
jgi:hypothetical protein